MNALISHTIHNTHVTHTPHIQTHTHISHATHIHTRTHTHPPTPILAKYYCNFLEVNKLLWLIFTTENIKAVIYDNLRWHPILSPISWKPSRQVQLKLPTMLLHVCAQPPLFIEHSFTSEKQHFVSTEKNDKFTSLNKCYIQIKLMSY